MLHVQIASTLACFETLWSGHQLVLNVTLLLYSTMSLTFAGKRCLSCLSSCLFPLQETLHCICLSCISHECSIFSLISCSQAWLFQLLFLIQAFEQKQVPYSNVIVPHLLMDCAYLPELTKYIQGVSVTMNPHPLVEVGSNMMSMGTQYVCVDVCLCVCVCISLIPYFGVLTFDVCSGMIFVD